MTPFNPPANRHRYPEVSRTNCPRTHLCSRRSEYLSRFRHLLVGRNISHMGTYTCVCGFVRVHTNVYVSHNSECQSEFRHLSVGRNISIGDLCVCVSWCVCICMYTPETRRFHYSSVGPIFLPMRSYVWVWVCVCIYNRFRLRIEQETDNFKSLRCERSYQPFWRFCLFDGSRCHRIVIRYSDSIVNIISNSKILHCSLIFDISSASASSIAIEVDWISNIKEQCTILL